MKSLQLYSVSVDRQYNVGEELICKNAKKGEFVGRVEHCYKTRAGSWFRYDVVVRDVDAEMYEDNETVSLVEER